MTLTDLTLNTSDDMLRKHVDLGQTLKDVLTTAMAEDRLLMGGIVSAEKLSSNPDNVTLCVLPVGDSDDATLSIQHTLLEAYCWENDIPVIKVDGAEKVGKILKVTNDENNNETCDLTCLLIENKMEVSKSEQKIEEFFQDLIRYDVDPHPVIELPV